MVEAVSDMVDRFADSVARRPRRKSGSVPLCGRKLAYADFHSLYYQARQIFLQQIYATTLPTERPRIIDVGGHVGLASLYFGLRYPEARITSVEMDPDLCAMLESNLSTFGLTNVAVRCAAAWVHGHGVSYIKSGDDSGHIDPDAGGARAPSLRVADLIQAEPVDLLKLDVEGAELEIIPDCKDALPHVSNLIVEVHSLSVESARLGRLFQTLDDAGFRYALFDYHPATWLPKDEAFPFPGIPTNKYIFTLYAYRQEVDA